MTTTKLICSLLLLCLLALSSTVSVQSKVLVRGAHSSVGLKPHSMGVRMLMNDNKDNKDNKDEVEEDDDKEDDDKEDDEDKDKEEEEEVMANEEETEAPEEEVTDAPEETEAPDATVVSEVVEAPPAEEEVEVVEEVAEVTDPAVEEEPTVDAPAGNTTDGDTVGPDEEFSVPLDPFSLTVDGAITEDDLDLETYLFNYMVTFMPNLVSIHLDSEVVTDGQTDQATGNSTRRMLRTLTANVGRSLTVQTFYYEGDANFVGPPARSHEEVDAALTYALEDTAALQAHLEATFPSANVAIDVGDSSAATAEGTETSDKSEESGLSTTGLSIVIVAACVGGISLLIILMVGLSGPSGDTSGIKGGLPEQPRS